MHRTRWSLVAGALLALAAAPAGDAAGQDVTVRAAPPTGGVVRAERWTPVVVTIDTSRSELSGELQLTWGDARIRRTIALASAGRRQFEFLLRTAEPEATIRVQLQASGRQMESLDVPVRVLSPDEPFTLCVMSVDGSTPDAICTASSPPDLLPRSLRGYEAVDEVVWTAGETRLSPEQRLAFDRWQALRELERSGDLGLSPQPARPGLRRGLPESTAEVIAALAAVYVACLLVAGVVVTRRRIGLISAGVVVAVVVAAGAGAAHALGDVGPGSAIQVHHGSVLQQIPRTDVSVLSMRGVIEFPTFDRFLVHLPLSDGTIEPASAMARAEQMVDDSGLPVIRGVYGLGSRQAFSAEGVVDLQLLVFTRTGDTATVANRSRFTLGACRFADGFSVNDVGSMAPGASTTARQLSEVLGPVFTCTVDAPVVALTSTGRTVESHGMTFIAVYDSRGEARAPTSPLRIDPSLSTSLTGHRGDREHGGDPTQRSLRTETHRGVAVRRAPRGMDRERAGNASTAAIRTVLVFPALSRSVRRLQAGAHRHAFAPLWPSVLCDLCVRSSQRSPLPPTKVAKPLAS